MVRDNPLGAATRDGAGGMGGGDGGNAPLMEIRSPRLWRDTRLGETFKFWDRHGEATYRVVKLVINDDGTTTLCLRCEMVTVRAGGGGGGS